MKNKTNIDWIVCAICDEQNRNNPEYLIEYKTVGFSKYGFGEIVVVGKIKNAEKIMRLINTFCRMLADGEEFQQGYTHVIDDNDGNKEFSFNIVYYYSDKELEKGIQLIPDFELVTHQINIH